MTTETLVPVAVILTVVAVLMLMIPTVMRPTTPLGVSVPVARLDEPIIRTAIRRYRVMTAGAWLLCLVLMVGLSFTAMPETALAGTFLFVIGQVVSYVVARQAIVRAKQAGGWYDGVPVRLAGTVTPEDRHVPIPVSWFIAAVFVVACATAVGVVIYPSLPHVVPTHWGLNGVANQYRTKSVWTVFGPLMIGTVVVVGLFALSFLSRVVPIRAVPGEDAAHNADRAHAMRTALATAFGRLMLLIALEFAWASVSPWLLPHVPSVAAIGALVVVALILVTVFALLLRWRRLMQGDARAVARERVNGSATDAPDDDRYWKAGILYVNRDDPALFVQRRFGVGWTINLGHPAGVVIGVILLMVVLGAVTFALTHAALGGG
jgi:uncharacterized membrane protein